MALGDPTAVPDLSERMALVLVSDWKHKTYNVSLVLSPGIEEKESRVVELQWRGTHDINKFCTGSLLSLPSHDIHKDKLSQSIHTVHDGVQVEGRRLGN